jgi:chemotaxis protein methyltransferase CheR
MTGPAEAIAELAALVETVSGNVIPPGHYPFLAELATRRAASLHFAGVETYVQALSRGGLPGEWSSLLPHITVKESFIFRYPQQFAAVAATILPELAEARAASRTLAVWSAGCARGEEPATLAVVLAHCPALLGWDWRVLATDVDEEALAAARTGRFGSRAVASVPDELRARYFTPEGDALALSPALARRIEFRTLNLVDDPFPIAPSTFDLIFMRNVLIYFRPEAQPRVAAAVTQALAPDGYLFLGPAETLWQLPAGLEAVDLGECFCYRHADVARPTATRAEAPPRELAGPDAAPRTGPRPVPGPTRRVGPPFGTRDRLLAAAECIVESRLDDAAGLVGEALLADPSDPAVHALEGFLHDAAARTDRAVVSYRASLYLDAALYQVRLLLAEALRRLGYEQRAAAEFRETLAALSGGRAREVDVLAGLPLPGRRETERRCREALSPQAP